MKKEPDKEEEYDVLPDDFLEDIARLKRHAAPEQDVPVPASILYPVSAALASEERKKEAEARAKEEARRKAEEEALKNPQPGQKMPDGTILLTQRQVILGKIFNAYAAAEDLPTIGTFLWGVRAYDETVEYIAKEYKAHGYSGGNYKSDKELYAAIERGDYNGEWFIPPRELVDGKDINSNEITPDNMVAYKDRDAFKGTFNTVAIGRAKWYWTSTDHSDWNVHMWMVNLIDGGASPEHSESRWSGCSCRPVRLELVP